MSSTKASGCRKALRFAIACGILSSLAPAWAGGPRFVSGSSGYNKAGIPMGWYTPQPLYFTDSGDLSPYVSHTQADAMVAAAANVWNVPTANLILSQGGSLAEHVDLTNTYFNGTDIVFPADVQSTNYTNIQIAVVYDTDGSITDLLLGSGASDPSGCLQNGVLESVDSFGTKAVIQHAIIVLNGRCAGSDPNQLTQMQYQLTRTFGRVLGLAWSQLNDSIFTGATPATALEESYWPLMHPIDIRCGPYTFQCMQNAFTLRPDDLSALAFLYPVTSSNALPGKTASGFDSVGVSGSLNFPTGQGMELANVTVRRQIANVDVAMEPYPAVSSTTGYAFMENSGSPVTGPEAISQNAGAGTASMEGGWSLTRIPSGARSTALLFQTESINPLYYGEYAVGPYQRPPISMSGSSISLLKQSITTSTSFQLTLTQATAASKCSPGSDGTASSPSATDPTGWWTGLLCTTGHTSWYTQSIQANRTWTIETTALDETGAPTPQKAQLVLGVWNATDPTGTLPTVASQPVALNSMSLGMTQLQMPSTPAPSTVRIAVADQFGAGRPDFAYQARILYADNLAPTTLGANGGQVTINGIGFRKGNQVTVNGIAATVTSWTSTQIIATAPTKGIALASSVPVDVAVLDPSTGGSTILQGALTYTGQATDTIALVSAPASLETGITAATPFAVRVYQPDGVTPAAGATVSFVVTGSGGGGAVLLNCGSGVGCTSTTDATGLAQQQVQGVAAGAITLTGTETSSGASVQATTTDTDPVRTVTIPAAPQYLAQGASATWTISLSATQDGAPAANAPVTWATAASGFTLTSPSPTTATDGTSTATVQVNAITGSSTNTIGGCVWTLCATWTVYGIAPPLWTASIATGGNQTISSTQTLAPVTVLITDGAGHPLPGATVNLYQTSYAWQGPCPTTGPCPSAPVLATAQSAAVSDANGQVQVTPIQVPSTPQVVNIAASTGTQGFATTSLSVTP
jgi:hypothetical protein